MIEGKDGITLTAKKAKNSLKKVFSKPLKFDPKKALAIDVANYDDNDIY